MAKEKNIQLLKKFLQDKPLVSFEDSPSFPNEEGIYTLAGMKRYFRSIGLSNSELDDALNQLQNDKKFELKSVQVYNPTFEQKYPYFYTPNVDNVEGIVKRLEREGEELKVLSTRKHPKGDANEGDMKA